MSQPPLSYHRIILDPRRKDLFLYVAAFEDANYLQVGLGYASANELQRKHVPHLNIHHFDVERHVKVIASDDDLAFAAGPLSDLFGTGLVAVERKDALTLCEALIQAHETAFGYHRPGALHRFALDKTGERLVYFKHDKRRDELQVGLAGLKDGLVQIGDPQFRITSARARDNVLVFLDPTHAVIFDKAPACWGTDRGAVLSGERQMQFAFQFRAIVEALWP